MNQYTTYKSSGNDWLGEIPDHWEVKRIKDLFKEFGSGTTPSTSNVDYYDEGTINWLNTTDLNNEVVNYTKQKITYKALCECGLKIYPPNSLAIAMYGQGKTRGTVGLLQIPTTTNQASCIMYKPINTQKLIALEKLYDEALRTFKNDKDKSCEMVGGHDKRNKPETAALVVVANAMLNLDEFITKN